VLIIVGAIAIIEAAVIAWLVRPRPQPFQPSEQIDRIHRALYGVTRES
jgi:hypothetical protein